MVKQRTFWQRMFGRQLSDGAVASSQAERIIVHSNAIGSTGTESYRGYASEEYLTSLRGRSRANLFDEMRRSDSTIKMCISSVNNALKSATWEVHPAANMKDKESAEKHAEFAKFIIFEDLNKPWLKILSEILSMNVFGHSLFELTDKAVVNHPKWGSYNGVESLGFRGQRTIERWNMKPNGDLLSVHQYAYGDLQRLVEIPADNLVLFNLDQEGSNFEGISPLRACYGAWYCKNMMKKLNMIGIEKFAVPTPIATFPSAQQNTEQHRALKEALELYTSNETNYLTLPNGWTVDLKSNVYDPSKVIEAIHNENEEIARSFLANFLMLSSSAKSGGSKALSTDLSTFFLSGLDYIAEEIEAVINERIIKRYIDMNFGPQEDYPKFSHSDVSDKADLILAQVIQTLVASGAIRADSPLEDHLRKRYHLPIADIASARQQQAQPGMGQPGMPGSSYASVGGLIPIEQPDDDFEDDNDSIVADPVVKVPPNDPLKPEIGDQWPLPVPKANEPVKLSDKIKKAIKRQRKAMKEAEL